MRSAVIVDTVRSPSGKGRAGGQLASLHAVELLGQVFHALLRRNDLDPVLVDDVLVGCVSQAGEQAGCPGRAAWLAAGGPDSVPAVTIDRRCGSSQQAAHFAAQGILSGAYDVAIAGGIESMSRVPMGSARMGADPFGPSVASRYAPGLVPQGVSAELMAQRWNIGREEMDAYAAASHGRASAVAAEGGFDSEIVPITTPEGTASRDETIRPGTDCKRLAALAPAFAGEEWARRYPALEWRVTAGNASQIADGASAVLVMEEGLAARLGLRPLARFHSFAIAADDPVLMLSGIMPATRKILARSGVALADIHHVEVNEAFACVPLAWAREFDVDPRFLNPLGGAIALGHPLGASGTRLLTTLVQGMRRHHTRYGLQVMCELGGMANATLIENLA